MSRVFDHRLSIALDKAIYHRDNAKTKIAYYYWHIQVLRLQKKIPILAVKK